MTGTTDPNTNTTSTSYDAMFRPHVFTDQLGNRTTYNYGSPTLDHTQITDPFGVVYYQYVDGLGRSTVSQTCQTSACSTLDTISKSYGWKDANNNVLTNFQTTTSAPCVQTALNTPCATIALTALVNPIAGPFTVTDGGGGTTSYTYIQNDVFVTIGPPPSGENAKRRQLEYDGLGLLTSVCEITSVSGSGSCGQKNSATGFLTQYTYDALGNLHTVTQNAQPGAIGGQQTRTYGYDGLSRLLSEVNPESGTTTYIYDTDSACNFSGLSTGSKGDLVSKTDANGNKTCYTYDSLHRVTDVGVLKNGACYPPVKRFRYDTTSNGVLPIPSGYSATPYASGRLIEAWTGDCVWPTRSDGYDSASDEWFAYSKRGETTDLWESTAHIAGYYHGTAGYGANGAVTSIGGIPGYASVSYGLDGEGRPYTATQGTTNFVTGVLYTAGSQPKSITFGTGDSDSYGYDGSTGRMTGYTFTVGSTPKSQTGTLTWNANSTLRTLAITDAFNSGGAQTCNFGTSTVMGYDDLGRLLSANCSPAWSQSFSYDPYGNITKSGSLIWNPGYSSATNHASSPITYDNNGNLLNDTFNTYGWYVDNKLGSTDSTTCTIFGSSNGTCVLYDALGRAVEVGVNGNYTEIMYTPVGKAAMLSDTTVQSAFFPLPGGGTLYETGSSGSNQYLWHKDWLGSVRLASTVSSRSVYFDRAFAPFGETYDNFGNTAENTFAGDAQDLFTGLFDTPNRELSSSEGRWLSPDPSGLTAVDPSNPQTWNRYAYVLNNPLSYVDPTGLYCAYLNDAGNGVESIDDSGGSGECGSNGGYWIEGSYGGGSWVNANADTGLVTGTGYDSYGNLEYSIAGAMGSNAWGAWTQTFSSGSSLISGLSLPNQLGSFSFTLGIRAPGQTYGQCLAANSGTYSINNWLPSSWQSGATEFFTGNDVSQALFGDANKGTAGLLVGAGVAAAPIGAGTAGTFGRRTASIFNLNLSGTTGPAPTILGKTGAKEAIGWVSGFFELKLAADIGATAAEALNCIGHR